MGWRTSLTVVYSTQGCLIQVVSHPMGDNRKAGEIHGGHQMIFGIHRIWCDRYGGQTLPPHSSSTHSPSGALERLSPTKLTRAAQVQCTSSYSQPWGGARWTGQLPWESRSSSAVTVLGLPWPQAEQAGMDLAAAVSI